MMNNLKMLEMALNQLKEYSSNEWVNGKAGERYNIDAVLSKIGKSKVETYSEQLQNELEPLNSKAKLYDELGVMSSGYYESYPNNLPKLIKEIEDE